MTIQCIQSNPIDLGAGDFEYTDFNCTTTQESATTTPTVSIYGGFSYEGLVISFFFFILLLGLIMFNIPKLKRSITEK